MRIRTASSKDDVLAAQTHREVGRCLQVAHVWVGMWIADEFPGFVGRQLRQIPDWTPPSRQACLHERIFTGAIPVVRFYLPMCPKRIALAAALLPCLYGAGEAQSFFPWAEDLFGMPPSRRYERPSRPAETLPRRREQTRNQHVPAAPVEDGGARPDITPRAPPIVVFPYSFPPASIVIDTSRRKLYYVLEGGRAYAYSVSVGREGFTWTGTEQISREQPWPDWYPPEEMRQRDPKLPEKMTGGVRNPLGAVALYLGTTLYRIHGTNDARSIGRAQSSGCFRMLNSAVLHLSSRVDVGTRVAVVRSLTQTAGDGPKS